MHAPFDLKIDKINADLLSEPTLINQGAENSWIAEFQLKDKELTKQLLSEEEYINFISSK